MKQEIIRLLERAKEDGRTIGDVLVEVRGIAEPVAAQPPTGNTTIPAGWKLVPIEPTHAMIIDGVNAGFDHNDEPYFIYAAMLNAAPAPPAPASSAEPEQYKTDDELGGVLAAIRHYGGQKWMEGRGVADDDLKNVREAWDAVYERVQALARYGKAGDAFWSRNGLRATLAPQPAASAEPGADEVTPEMMRAAHAAAREYYERTGGNDPAVIYRAMRRAALAEQPDPNVRYGDGFHDGYWKGREEGWDAAVAVQKADDARDAERYRWLRVRWGRIADTYDGDSNRLVEIREADDRFEGWDVSPESLDAAIDAALVAQQGEGGGA